MRPSQINIHQILTQKVPSLFKKSVTTLEQRIKALKVSLEKGPVKERDISLIKLQKYEARQRDFLATEVRLQIKVVGEGGGDYGFHLKNGKLTVETPLKKSPDFTVIQTVAGLKEAIIASENLEYSLFNPDKKLFPFPKFIGKPQLDSVLSLPGGLKFVVEGEYGWEVFLMIGPLEKGTLVSLSSPARTTICLKYRDFIDIARGELHPERAVITGRFKITGDFGYVLRLAKIMVGIMGLK